MPERERFDESAGQAELGATNLLSYLSHSKHLTSGFAGFAIKTLVVSFSAATVWGLSTYMLFHGAVGPALSFLGGSAIGFTGGLVSRWRTDVAEALVVADKYPLLIEHHVLLGEAGQELRKQSFADWAGDLHSNPRKQSIVIAALYSAAPSLERLRQQEEEAIISSYSGEG